MLGVVKFLYKFFGRVWYLKGKGVFLAERVGFMTDFLCEKFYKNILGLFVRNTVCMRAWDSSLQRGAPDGVGFSLYTYLTSM